MRSAGPRSAPPGGSWAQSPKTTVASRFHPRTDDVGGYAEHVQEALNGGPWPLRRGRGLRCAAPVGLGRPEQMVPFLLGQALGVGPACSTSADTVFAVPLFQARVVRVRHSRRLRRLLAARAGYPPSLVRGQAGVFGLEPGPARTQDSLSSARRSSPDVTWHHVPHVKTSLCSVGEACSQMRSSVASTAGRRAAGRDRTPCGIAATRPNCAPTELRSRHRASGPAMRGRRS